MRPRHKAAENLVLVGMPDSGFLASMRPRHKAAENALYRPMRPSRLRASMRPRHKAAENFALTVVVVDDNEMLQ